MKACAYDWIAPGLAVGGGFACRVADRLAREGVRAVIDLRGETRDDEAELAARRIALLHLPTPDRRGVGQRRLDAGTAFAAGHFSAGAPVLVHCQHGIGRAPLLALCILVDRGLEPLEALRLAKQRRPQLSLSPHQFRAWARWIERRHAPVPPPDFEAFARLAYSAAA